MPRIQQPTPVTSLRRARCSRGKAFTLVEVLVTVTVMGIAGALVIPAMTQTNALRVQGAVRMLVADITFVQADAMAFQSRRAVVFGQVARQTSSTTFTYGNGNGYTLAEVTGPVLNLAANAMSDPGEAIRPLSRDFDDERFGGASITGVNIGGTNMLVFDELGSPVVDLTGDGASVGGTIDISAPNPAPGITYRVTIAPMTGRITVAKTSGE